MAVGTTTAILGAAGIGSNIFSGIMGSRAAGKAAKEQSAAAERIAAEARAAAERAGSHATDVAGGVSDTQWWALSEANKELQGLYNRARADYQPYQEAGTRALAGVEDLAAQEFAFDPSKLPEDPGYQFRLEEGQKALERSAAARGGVMGGGTLKALSRYAQGVAADEFQNAYNRALTTFQTNQQNRAQALSALLGTGLTATDAATRAGQVYGATTAGNLMDTATRTGDWLNRAAQYSGDALLQGTSTAGNALAGGANAQAASRIAQANAWGDAATGATNAATNMIALSQLLNPQAAGAGSSYETAMAVMPRRPVNAWLMPGYTG